MDSQAATSPPLFRLPRNSPLCRIVLHYKIEKDVEGVIRELLENEQGKLLIQNLLHSAADSGRLDLFSFRRDFIEYGIRYYPTSEVGVNLQSTRKKSAEALVSTIPKAAAPYRGQMFITADLGDGREADFVWKAEKIFSLLGTPALPSRPHSVARRIDETVTMKRHCAKCNDES